MNKELTNEQIAAGAAVKGDNGKPIGRNVAIDVFDAICAAAANKAAEEGELLDMANMEDQQLKTIGCMDAWAVDQNLPAYSAIYRLAIGYDEIIRRICFEYSAGGYNSEGLMVPKVADQKLRWIIEDVRETSARQAIAADRASRQVANKAEVDLTAHGLLKMWIKANEMATAQAPAPIQFARLLLATPPATNGASTVLTDELIERDFLKHWDSVSHDYGFHREFDTAYKAARAAWFVREVAAQAGQVAVPEDVAKKLARYEWLKERFTGYDFYWGGDSQAEREEDQGKCVIVFECGQNFPADRHFERSIDSAIVFDGPQAAAPSPAKELK